LDAESFDLGFDYSPLELAASQFLDVARDVGELQERAGRVAQTTLDGYRKRLAPMIQRATSAVADELRRIEGEVRTVEASAPQFRDILRIGPGAPVVPGGIPPIAEPVPPPPGIPPVVQPGGRAWVVMTLETCGPDNFTIRVTQTVPYVDGAPVNPPAGYTIGPVFNDLIAANQWAQNWIAGNPRTPCGEPQPPAPEPEPPTLPPFGCPPPSCTPICPAPEPEPPKLDYCVWYRLDPVDCIVLSAEQKDPPDAGYKKEACYKTSEEAEAAAKRLCERLGKQTGPEPGTSPGTPPGSYCDSRTWGNGELLEQLSSLWAQFADQAVKGVGPADKVADGATFIADYVFPWFFSDAAKDIIAKGLRFFGGSLFDSGNQVAAGAGCDNDVVGPISTVNMIFSVLSKWIGNPPPRATAAMQYAEAYLCPWLLPSAGEVQALFQAGVIDEATAVNLGRLNGRCDDTTLSLLAAGQARLAPGEVVDAYRRGAIDRGRAETELRARGYLREDALETYLATTRFLPGPSDLVRFLVRDAFDEAGVVQRFGLDSEFAEKWPETGPGRYLADSQGVDEQTLKYFWRAHWTIPSPTQLGEFWKRLRPGRPVDAARSGRIGLTGIIPEWSPRANPELQVTSEDIDLALGQQDILPFWRDKFRAVQFLPLTRTDARRAYDIGVLKTDDVYESLIQDGYREEDALVLTEFAFKEKNLGIRNSEPAKLFTRGLQSEEETAADLAELGFAESAINNFLTREIRSRMRAARSLPEFVEFVAGNLDEPDLRIVLEDFFYRPDQIDELIATAKRLGKARFRSACTEAAKTRFLWGELETDAAKKELRGFGWSVWAADEIVAGWECTLAVSDKLPTVRQLLAWIDLGVIAPADFRQRMKRLRFPDEDIDRFLAQAVEQRAIRAGKDLERAVQEQERRLAKERAAAERAAQRAARAGEKRLKAVQAARTLAERLALAINAAAVKWAKFLEVPFQAAVDELRTYVDAIASTRQLSAETATKVVVRSVEWAIPNQERDLGTVVELLATEVDSTADTLESQA